MRLFSKILFYLLFVCASAYAQLPANIGFENGTFDGWECSSGVRDLSNNFVMNPVGVPNSRHLIIGPSEKGQLDQYGHFPVLCPNGSNYSIKLGSTDTPRYVERLARTLKNIPPNFSFVFNYAIVLDANASHGPNDQPLFRVEIFDVGTGNKLPCPAFNFVANLGIPGFTTSDVTATKNRGNSTNPVYRNWTTATIDLKDYAGKDIRVEFTTADCNGSVHFAYAYIDIDEKLSLKPITGATFCLGQDSTTLLAPDGYKNYLWYKANNLNNAIGDGQNLRVKAIDKEAYAVKLLAYDDFGCDDILYTTLEELKDTFKLVVKNKTYACPGIGVDLTSKSITAGSSTMTFTYYYKNELGLVYLPNPQAVLDTGTFYIRGTNAGGCTDMLPIQILLASSELKINDPPRVQYPVTVDLSRTFDPLSNYTYAYFSDATATTSIQSIINKSGTYYVKATNGTGCITIAAVKVVIDPPPPYDIVASNMFTPNGDGINDKFFIKLDGYITFSTLNIFNRYGQKVFSTKSAFNYWDGNEGTKQLPAGTYYWIFEGIDQYTGAKVTKASSITIVR